MIVQWHSTALLRWWRPLLCWWLLELRRLRGPLLLLLLLLLLLPLLLRRRLQLLRMHLHWRCPDGGFSASGVGRSTDT